MLHELIFVLNGFPGGVFVKDSNGNIKVNESNLTHLHPSEVNILNKLCILATYYLQFKLFIRDHQHNLSRVSQRFKPEIDTEEGSNLFGLYLQSFCIGLDDCLDEYRNVLLEVEQKLLTDDKLSFSTVQVHLEKFHLLFPAISNLVLTIRSQKAHGCRILETLYTLSISGIPIVQECFSRIHKRVQNVLYKQLAAWLLHGVLLDDFKEFFIRRLSSDDSADEQSLPLEDDPGVKGITARQLSGIRSLSLESPPIDSSNVQFEIKVDMLPSYIPIRVAEKILFVGESMQIFNEGKAEEKYIINPDSIIKAKEKEFSQELLKLSTSSEFNLSSFESIIDKIRSYIAEKLYSLVVTESNLVTVLSLLKEFYLLSRGELFLAFIDQADSLLRLPPANINEHDLNSAFHQAAHNVLYDNDKVLQSFTFKINTKRKKSVSNVEKQGDDENFESGWKCLNMSHSVEWPLQTLLTQNVLDRYNNIFKFLLHMKRIQVKLQHCWNVQMHNKNAPLDVLYLEQWSLRNHMSFLIDNIQYYLQVDVIESQFSILVKRINSTTDFQAIRHAHDVFITSLLSQSFLLSANPPIHQSIVRILETCESFCGLLSHSNTSLTNLDFEGLKVIKSNFQRQSNMLFLLLSNFRNHQASPHLSRLLLRVDFNRYFSRAGGQLGSSNVSAVDASQLLTTRRH